MKAACFSVAAMDYFPQEGEFYAGGNALNQAIQFSRQGFDTCFLGALGTDEPGDRIADLLHEAAVDTTRMQRIGGRSASNIIMVDELGERSSANGAWDNGVYDEFRLREDDWRFINECDVVTTHADCPDYQMFLHRIGNQPLVTADFLHLEDYELMMASAGSVDIIYSGGHKGMIDDLKQIALDTGMLVVLTLGADGSMAFFKQDVFIQGALPIERVVDTTGCGDAFQAAFTCEYMRSGNIRDSLVKGAHAGRMTAARFGGAEWL